MNNNCKGIGMKEKNKIIIILLFSAIGVLVVIPLIVNGLFMIEAPCKLFAVKWCVSDALSYVAGYLAFLGTSFLGWVAWKQNDDLKKIEKHNFIAQNSCMALISNLQIGKLKQQAVNFEEHPEQIVKTDFPLNTIFDYSSFNCQVTLDRIEHIPAMVRVSSLFIWIGNEQSSKIITAKNYDGKYTRIAISKEKDRFNILVLIKKPEKDAFVKCLEDSKTIVLDLKLELVSGNHVSTSIKCQAQLERSSDNDLDLTTTYFFTSKELPTCFWFGNNILQENDVKFRMLNH